LQEVSIHKQLVHPNIVGLYDVIETPYHFVLAMEYLDGGDLFDLVPPNEGCPEPEVRPCFVVDVLCSCKWLFVLPVIGADSTLAHARTNRLLPAYCLRLARVLVGRFPLPCDQR
jgi:hypothetical protein